MAYYNWASVSEPHTCDFNATFSLYVIGASVSEPHTSGYNAAFSLSIYNWGERANGVAGAEMRILYIIYLVRQRGPGGPNSSRAAAPCH